MANGKLPLLGGAEILDLQAHVKDKKMRELLAQLVAERNRAMDHVRLVSLSLLEASEVLAECIPFLERYSPDPDDGESPDTDAACAVLAKVNDLLGLTE